MRTALSVVTCVIVPHIIPELTEVQLTVIRKGVDEPPFRLRTVLGRPFRLVHLSMTSDQARKWFMVGSEFFADLVHVGTRGQNPGSDFRSTDRAADPKTFTRGDVAMAVANHRKIHSAR